MTRPVFLAPNLRLLDQFTAVLTRVPETQTSVQTRRVRLDLSAGLLGRLLGAARPGDVCNLSAPADRSQGPCRLRGVDASADDNPGAVPIAVPTPGDVLLLRGAWRAGLDHVPGELRPLYLNARRICQVRL